MKSKLLILSAALMLVLAGCSGDKKSEFTPASSGQTSGDTVAVTGVSLDRQSLNLMVGDTETLVATVAPENASNRAVNWSATGDGVVSVDNGLVRALKAGDAVVTATTVDGNFTASCNVHVAALEKPDIAYSDGTFDFNGTEQAGKFVYWAGDGGNVTVHSYDSSTKKYTLTFTTGWAWYGVQVFYLLPYAEAEDRYDITWVVNSQAAGQITVNGSVKSLVAGDNTIEFSDVGLSGNRTLNVQMGVDGGAQQFTLGNTITFGNPVVKDKTSNVYYRTTFAKDSNVLKDIQVKSGKKVTAPADPVAPAGQVFKGWYDGEVKFDSTQAVTAAHNYVATFIDEGLATKYTVSVYDGSDLLGTIEVLEGSKVDLSSIQFPFGYEADSYYKNSGLTEAFDPAVEIINESINIYAKKRVMVTNACYNMYDSYVSHLADGSLQIQLEGWGANVWDVQLNYVLPVGNYNYTIDFHYSIDKAGADVQIYDNATKAGPVALTTGSNVAQSISYNGALTAQNKLTFELGALPSGQVATFVLHDITLHIA